MPVQFENEVAHISNGVTRVQLTEYSNFAKVLHWLMAFLIFLNASVGWSLGGETIANGFGLLLTHFATGLLVLLLLLVRVSWRRKAAIPKLPSSVSTTQNAAAKVTHQCLYGLMLLVPISGLWASLSWEEISLVNDASEALGTLSPEPAFSIRIILHSLLVNLLLVLAGDIQMGWDQDGQPALIALAEEYAREAEIPVVVVAGNQDLYGSEYSYFMRECRFAASKNPRIHFLENSSTVINGVRFVGCTLWTDFGFFGNTEEAIGHAKEYVNDFKYISHASEGHAPRQLTPEDLISFHQASKERIISELARPFEGARIAVTHFPPVYMGGGCDALTPYNNNNSMDEITSGRMAPDLWISGHVQGYPRRYIGNTLVVSRQGRPPRYNEEVKWGIVDLYDR